MTQNPTDSARDADLISRCTVGEADAWDEFVERFSGLVYFSICHLLRTRGLSLPDDLVGEVHNAVFLSLLEDDFRRLKRFSGRCKLSHWLKVVSVNRTIDLLRKRKPALRLDDPKGSGATILDSLVDQAGDPEEAAMRAERVRVLNGVIHRLPEADQVLVRLLYIEGEPGEYVARRLGTTVGAVYTRKNRLRKRLVRLLREGAAGEVLSVPSGRKAAS